MEGPPASPAASPGRLCFACHDGPAPFGLLDPGHVDGGGRIGGESASGRGVGVDGNGNVIVNGRGCDGCGGAGALNRALLAGIAWRVSRAMALLLCWICGS